MSATTGVKYGPNVRKLIAVHMANRTVCPTGNLAKVMATLSNPSKFKEAAKESAEFVEVAINAVRMADLPNEYRLSTDEEIAAEILRRVDEGGK